MEVNSARRAAPWCLSSRRRCRSPPREQIVARRALTLLLPQPRGWSPRAAQEIAPAGCGRGCTSSLSAGCTRFGQPTLKPPATSHQPALGSCPARFGFLGGAGRAGMPGAGSPTSGKTRSTCSSPRTTLVGLSPVAVLVAAVVWTTLWGPVGLLLSTRFGLPGRARAPCSPARFLRRAPGRRAGAGPRGQVLPALVGARPG